MLKTKSILNEKEESDGLRISIMSKHTLNDGKTCDKRITNDSYDLWRRDLAPSNSLVGRYYRNEVGWEEFKDQYLSFLFTKKAELQELSREALSRDITLLCIEESSEKCHRRLLAEFCKKLEPRLEIIIN